MTRALVFAGAMSLTACADPVASCAPERSVLGTWRYLGGRDAPDIATLAGSMEISSESCQGFQGRLDILQSDAEGTTTRLAGPVAGRLTSDGGIRFDAWLAGIARQHIAVLGPGLADGSWIGVGGPAVTETGAFRVTREE